MIVETKDERFAMIVDREAVFERFLTGFRFTEGPGWYPHGRYSIFSDILGNRIRRWKEGKNSSGNAREANLPYNVAVDAMKDNRLFAFGMPNPIPSPAVLRAATAAPIRILPITGKVREGLSADNAAYFAIDIPAGSYNNRALTSDPHRGEVKDSYLKTGKKPMKNPVHGELLIRQAQAIVEGASPWRSNLH